MTEQLFFDTDCLVSFLWVDEQNLLLQLYPGRIVLPMQVYNELTHPSVQKINKAVRALYNAKQVQIMTILSGTTEFNIYNELVSPSGWGVKAIGRGEAAAIALCKAYNGILASNNMRDISDYVNKYSLKHLTTGDILTTALIEGYISETTGNEIWIEMINRKRFLPTKTFSDYLKMHKP